MRKTRHPVEPEELMAYLDGELAAARAAEALAHLEKCGECQRLVEQLRSVSREMDGWEVEGAAFGMRQAPALTMPRRRRWIWVGVGVAAAVVVVGVTMTILAPLMRVPGFEMSDKVQAVLVPVAGSQDRFFNTESGRVADAEKPKAHNPLATVIAPLIARTAEISLIASDFTGARARLDAMLAEHSGYAPQITVSTPGEGPRSIEGTVSVPSPQLDAALADLRKLGRVEGESQNGTDVTAQSVDVDARLTNARNTERCLVQLIADRSGGLKDVLAVEVEIGRVRGEIESMEAQQKSLATRIARATITIHIADEERSRLSSDNIGLRLRNAAVDGVRAMRDSLIGAAVFISSRGPVLLLWAAILFFPVRFAWRRWRRTKTSL